MCDLTLRRHDRELPGIRPESGNSRSIVAAWFNEWIWWVTDQIRRVELCSLRSLTLPARLKHLLGKVLGEPGASATGGYTTPITSAHDSSTVTPL